MASWPTARSSPAGLAHQHAHPSQYLSSATVWEVAIGQSMGKIIEPAHLPEIIKDAGFRHLPITAAHAGPSPQLRFVQQSLSAIRS